MIDKYGFRSNVGIVLLNDRGQVFCGRRIGMSAWQFLMPSVVLAFLLGVVATTIYNPISATLQERSKIIEAEIFNQAPAGQRIEGAAFWVRQRTAEGQAIINAKTSRNQGSELGTVTVFTFNTAGQYLERIDAGRAVLGSGVWHLSDVRIYAPGNPPVTQANYTLKTNLTPEQPSLGFWIESQPGSDVARIAWEDTPVRYNAEDLLSAAQNEEERTERTDAAEWLMDYLREGPVPSAQVYRDAKKDGHAERTIRRAQASLNIKAVKEGFGKEGHWVWRLPDKDVPNMSNGPLCQSEATFSHVSSSSGHLRETNMATHNEHVHRWPQNGNMAKLDNLAVPWEETT